MAEIGDTFRLRDSGIDSHLHVIISDPSQDDSQIVTVNFTSWQSDKDQSCIIEVGEHSFIKTRSCVDYRREPLISLSGYEQLLRSGALSSRAPVSKALLKRIIRGAGISPYIPFGNLQILLDQGLLDTYR